MQVCHMMTMPGIDTPGHPAGVALGAKFSSRAELSSAGVHLPPKRGVAMRHPQDGDIGPEGYPLATSLIDFSGHQHPAPNGAPTIEYRLPDNHDHSFVRRSYSSMDG